MESAASIRIFLVDDHRSVLWGLERLIDSNAPRMQVVGKATTIKDALVAIRGASPDLILLDLDLGAESGLDAVPAFISNSQARVLILTGLRDTEMHDKAILAGARGIVSKEESPENILKAVEKVHDGELWLDRASTSRIFVELSRHKGLQAKVDPEREKIETLTPRERQIAAAIALDAGATTRNIAKKLHLSDHTIRNHLTSIYDKLGLANRLELYAFATKHQIKAD